MLWDQSFLFFSRPYCVQWAASGRDKSVWMILHSSLFSHPSVCVCVCALVFMSCWGLSIFTRTGISDRFGLVETPSWFPWQKTTVLCSQKCFCSLKVRIRFIFWYVIWYVLFKDSTADLDLFQHEFIPCHPQLYPRLCFYHFHPCDPIQFWHFYKFPRTGKGAFHYTKTFFYCKQLFSNLLALQPQISPDLRNECCIRSYARPCNYKKTINERVVHWS